MLAVVAGYFALLMAVAWRTSRGADSESFFIGNRSSRWYLVAFGMIGTSLSGVTFVSVPGAVGREGFAYFQLVLGLFLGYLVIAYVPQHSPVPSCVPDFHRKSRRARTCSRRTFRSDRSRHRRASAARLRRKCQCHGERPVALHPHGAHG